MQIAVFGANGGTGRLLTLQALGAGLRRAQLHNWQEATAHGVDADETAVAPELRELRARAWSALDRAEILWREKSVVSGAARLVDGVTQLKKLDDPQTLGESADAVRRELSTLMDVARDSLLNSIE